ncbi:hypothetical protein M758_2G074500 [Ceratodon purpureus]|nr:hypothetical protein M758_2G074500 [Ceratodon purpureus]
MTIFYLLFLIPFLNPVLLQITSIPCQGSIFDFTDLCAFSMRNYRTFRVLAISVSGN